jgi:CBS domain-containing protein
MRHFNTGVLVIVDDLERRKVLGILTDRDLCIRVLAANGDPEHMTVQECMTSHPVCCKAQEEIEPVMASMAVHKIRRVPVVNGANALEGLITDRDLLENAEIDPHALCVALGRIIASTKRSMDMDSVTAFP